MLVDLVVTQEHIDNGVKGNAMRCAIGLALRPLRAKYAMMTWPGGHLSPPQVVLDFIEAFDAGKPVQPFTTQVEVYKK